MNIVSDINYLINEIKFIKEDNFENKAITKMIEINEDINNKYFN